MTTRIIGIDFGTSTTVVRVHNIGAGNRIVPVAVNGERTIPSIAFKIKESDNLYFGYDAKAKIDSNIEGTAYSNFKMDLISDDEEKRTQAESLIQGFMRYVFEQYQNLMNNEVFDPADIVKVYVSHPAKWNSHARTFMKQCIEDAGFCKLENISLKDEPTAALLAVMHEKNSELKEAQMLHNDTKYKAMMIDMGAGTTDIVLCSYRISNNKLKIGDIFTYPSINTPGLCGGREIDDAIMSEVKVFVNKMQAKPSSSGNKVVNKIHRNVKTWKERTVSKVLSKNSVLPEPDEIAAFRETLSEFGVPIMNEGERFSLDRKQFESITNTHWQQWTDLLQGAFDEVKKTQYENLDCPKQPEDVELMIVTGGHSQWYIVQEYLTAKNSINGLKPINFSRIHSNPNRLIQSEDPQETVAVGLCHLDEDIVGTIAASNDVSISFSCEGKHLGGCKLIKKGVPLPYEKKNFCIRNSINGNFIFRKELTINYHIVTDKTNTIKKSCIIPSTGAFEMILKAVLSMIGIAIIDIPEILICFFKGDWDKLNDSPVINDIKNNDYTIVFSPIINVNKEGIIKVTGKIEIDGECITIPETVI